MPVSNTSTMVPQGWSGTLVPLASCYWSVTRLTIISLPFPLAR